jgi:hypothetical protein
VGQDSAASELRFGRFDVAQKRTFVEQRFIPLQAESIDWVNIVRRAPAGQGKLLLARFNVQNVGAPRLATASWTP